MKANAPLPLHCKLGNCPDPGCTDGGLDGKLIQFKSDSSASLYNIYSYKRLPQHVNNNNICSNKILVNVSASTE